jgi:hypothetical protein
VRRASKSSQLARVRAACPPNGRRKLAIANRTA